MSHLIELSQNLKDIFKGFQGKEDDVALSLLYAGLKEFLKKCEEEILELEIKYGMSFEKFKEDLDSGKLGDLHSYPLEKDAMLWEDLVREKQLRLVFTCKNKLNIVNSGLFLIKGVYNGKKSTNTLLLRE